MRGAPWRGKEKRKMEERRKGFSFLTYFSSLLRNPLFPFRKNLCHKVNLLKIRIYLKPKCPIPNTLVQNRTVEKPAKGRGICYIR